jgi:hypothetical protein
VKCLQKPLELNSARWLLWPYGHPLVYKGLNVTEEAFGDAASEVLFFQNKPVLKDVMETIETMAERVYGPRRTCGRTHNAGERIDRAPVMLLG